MTDGKGVFDAGSWAFVIWHLAFVMSHLAFAMCHLAFVMCHLQRWVQEMERPTGPDQP
jgi:heme exporter protein D